MINCKYLQNEKDNIIKLADSVISDKEKELQELNDIKRYALFNEDIRLEHTLIDIVILNEKSFLDTKQLALYIKDESTDTNYNAKDLGKCDVFNSTIEKIDGVWKLHLPPMPSLKVRNKAAYNGRFITLLVQNLLSMKKDETALIDSPAVVFVHNINQNRAANKLFDADNMDSKKALDALKGILIKEDNLLELLTLHFGKKSNSEYCDMYIMDRKLLPEWLEKNM